MFTSLFFSFLGIILFLLPLFYSLETQQIFSVNKFFLLLFFTGITVLVFSARHLYTLFHSKSNIHYTISRSSFFFLSALIGVLSLSTFFSHSPLISFYGSDSRHYGVLFLLILIITFFSIRSHKPTTRDIVSFLFIPLTLSGIITAVWAILQYIHLPPIFGGILNFASLSARSFAGMGQPNFCAQFLLFPFFIAWYFLIHNYRTKSPNKYTKWYIFFSLQLIFLYLTALYTTGSRAGMLGIITGSSVLLSTFFASKYFNTFLYGKYILSGSLITLFIGIIGLFLLIVFFGESIAHFFGNRGESIAARFYFWNDALHLIPHFFWTGTGADMLSTPFAQTLSVQALEPENFSSLPDRSHSIILDILLQYGIFGFLLFIFGIWKTVHTAIKNIQHSFTSQSLDLISIIALSGLIALFTSWTFGFAVITDSFIAVIFLALIFRTPQTASSEKNIISLHINRIFHILITLLSLFFSLFLLKTAFAINASEKSLYTLTTHTNLPQKIQFQHAQNILNTPYFENNLLKAYPYFSETHQKQIITLGNKYHFENDQYYEIQLFRAIQENNINKARTLLRTLQKHAGNFFPKHLQVINIAKYYNLLSPEESSQQLHTIANTLIPAYYFDTTHQTEKKWQKFWKHHREEGNILRRYK